MQPRQPSPLALPFPDLSVVIPTRNAAHALPATLAALGDLPREVVVADCGSADGTAVVAAELGARVVPAPEGRGHQIAAGVAAASGQWLLLLHADTVLSPGWTGAVAAFTAAPDASRVAGYFAFRLDEDAVAARRLERAVAWRCRWLALPYGDQGLLIHRGMLARIGGVPEQPIMEDVALVRRLGRARIRPIGAEAITSAAKFRRDGYLKRSAGNFGLLSLWFAGVPPKWLARIY
ncbi:TIGR04283 family arsenosugar biosynthesis glycosyltransferase [Elioraea sp.]|uniref:TIGR04283 family arsenosugar biosynthesis glycosyltransferase n=1 Tax=Elioraea sp. TaxID=2185103 RepID=UPI0025BDD5F4|nr:TIGR04283 family arsenosugar biosynthesis glycosyltransferase [Elioraea sp.]